MQLKYEMLLAMACWRTLLIGCVAGVYVAGTWKNKLYVKAYVQAGGDCIMMDQGLQQEVMFVCNSSFDAVYVMFMFI